MDMTAIPWGALANAGSWVLVVVVLIRGDLVPRKSHEEIVGYWRQRHEDQMTANAENTAALRSIARMLDRLPPPGGDAP